MGQRHERKEAVMYGILITVPRA